MGTRVTSTSTVYIPAYAGWECSACGEKNFREAVIAFSASSSTKAFPTKKELERIENNSNQYVDELWRKKALGIIRDPIKNYSRFGESFHVYDCNCQKCGHKEKWNQNRWFVKAFGFGMPLALISIIWLISEISSVGAWLFFLLVGAFVGGCIYAECHFKTVLKKIPKRSMPIIGSMNPDLTKHAKENGYKLLLPQEVLERLSADGTNVGKVSG